MKKGIALMSALLLVLSLLTACGQAPAQNDQTQAQETTAQKADETTVAPAETTAAETSAAETKADATTPAAGQHKVLVDAAWVKNVIDGKDANIKNYKVFEISWGAEKDSPDYLKGHIPGAVHVDTSSVEEGPLWNLVAPDVMEKNMLGYGITKDTVCILYGNESAVARVAFAYLWAGVENVKVLDGGLKAWETAGYALETKSNAPVPAKEFGAKVPVHPEYVLSLKQVEEKLKDDKNFRLVSIRSKEEFDGKTSGYSYIPKAGEPKGAVWGHAGSDANHMEDYLHKDGTYITLPEMEKLWADRGINTKEELSFYCGTGWRASIPWLILYDQGIFSTVYDGGWNEWQMHLDLDVQVGDPQSGNVKYEKVKDLPDGMEPKK